MKTNSASCLMRGLKNYPLTKSQITKKLTKYQQDQLKIQVDHCQIQVTWNPDITL